MHLRFKDLAKDPVAAIRSIYSKFGLIYTQPAIDFILESKTLLARDFPQNTLFDEVLDAQPEVIVARAVEYAAAVARNEQGPLPLVRHRSLRQGEDTVAVLARARDRAVQLGPVAVAAVEATAGGVEAADFDVGMNRAREIYDSLSFGGSGIVFSAGRRGPQR